MFRTFLAALVATGLLAPVAQAQDVVEIGPDGLHKQSWFFESTGDMRLDLLAAAAAEKNLIVLVEQEGCVYCVKLHNVNFAKPEIVELLSDNFLVVQLDMLGEGAVTGFDGKKMTEAQLMRRWGVNATPTTLVLRSANPSVRTVKEAEIFRLPGYLEPFEYFSVIDYFASGAYEYLGLGAYMTAKAADFTERGIDPNSW